MTMPTSMLDGDRSHRDTQERVAQRLVSLRKSAAGKLASEALPDAMKPHCPMTEHKNRGAVPALEQRHRRGIGPASALLRYEMGLNSTAGDP